MATERLTDHHRRVLCELIGVDEKYNKQFCFPRWKEYGLCIEAIKADKELWDSWAWHIEIKWEEVKCNTNCNDIFEWLLDPARCLEIAEFILNRKEKENV